MTHHPKTTAIIVAGGIGTRMQADIPKQFLSLGDKPVARYSFDLFLSMPEIDEIVVVCAPEYQKLFSAATKPIHFALPGERRQDSVFNGLKATSPSQELVLTHDSARPFIDRALVLRALTAGNQWGAATVGMPVKFTVKVSNPQHFVENTPDRTHIWEIQTPQVLHRNILEEGFRMAHQKGLTVTDDVSLAELVGKEVKLVEGSHMNIKVTVPSDLAIANHLLHTLKK